MINEVRYNRKASSSISTPFQHKYPFQNPKKRFHFSFNDIKIQKEVWEKSGEKSAEQAGKEEDRV